VKKKILILLPALALLAVLAAAQNETPRVVEISAKKFEYAPNVVTLKKGQPVTLRVTALDRAHGLLVPAFHIDLDAIPGTPAETTFTPAESGKFDAICDHYCGSGHGNMKMTFVVED
jgi:cytochrome c oxidase subunit 2